MDYLEGEIMMRLLLLFLLFTNQLQAATPEVIVLGAGCFWCIQPPYDALKDKGVLSTRVGFAGGHVKNPSYEQVTQKNTGHIEVIEVVFDSEKISLSAIMEIYWKNIDPFNDKGQFCDSGEPYLSAIFYSHDEQKKAIDESLLSAKKTLKANGKLEGEFATVVRSLDAFYPAEEKHQGYYLKNPIRYKFYRTSCGRDKRLKELWN
jgi:peptide-methionine (S)-S-oxide reductase